MLPGFHIAGFWSALLGALVISIASWLATTETLEATPWKEFLGAL
jgi:uncharacterized membrane protein YvlD (DUF360 family)